MIKETFYKDRPAVELSCDKLTAIFLPKDGGKLASFRSDSGFEYLLQTEGEKYRRLDLEGDFEKSECSGFDDMFPTIDPCVVNGLDYLDHGEICRHEQIAEIDSDRLTLYCTLQNLNIFYKKTAYLKDDALFVEYHIENSNDFDFQYLWAGHIMIKGEEGAYTLSNLDGTPRKIVSGQPVSEESAHILPPKIHNHYKFYYTDAKPPVKCGVVFPKSNTEICVECDGDVIKYFGAWVNAGDLNGAYTIAIEPCTALFDDPIRAKKANAYSVIKAHESVEFTLKISYKNG